MEKFQLDTDPMLEIFCKYQNEDWSTAIEAPEAQASHREISQAAMEKVKFMSSKGIFFEQVPKRTKLVCMCVL